MAFQFLCPQGHLLEGSETLMGQTCQCPHCASVFVVPTLARAAPSIAAPAPAAAPPTPETFFAPQEEPPTEDLFAAIGVSEEPVEHQSLADVVAGAPQHGAAEGRDADGGAAVLPQDDPHRLLRLICPCERSMELPTPQSMLGSDALCPYCHLQFHLRYEDTVEYREQREQERERREQELGKKWMNWAFAFAGLIVVGLVVMIVLIAIQ